MPKAVNLPKPVQFGRADDDRVWLAFETAGGKTCSVTWPGNLREASAVAQAWNAVGTLVEALNAVRSDVRDPDTNTILASATVGQIDEALAAAGVRL